jgi:hypothetical protein
MTMPKWSFKMPNPLTIRRAAFWAAVAVALLPLSVRAADSAPDWLRAAAQQKLPDYDKETNAVVLLSETQTTVRDNGDIETLHRGAIRILREEGRRQFEFVSATFDKDTKISYMKAWTIESNGHDLAVPDKDAIETGYLTDEVYEDVKMRSMRFLEANVGNVVGYEYVQRQRHGHTSSKTPGGSSRDFQW